MNATHLTAKLPALLLYRIMPIIRRALYDLDMRLTPMSYQHAIKFAEQIATDGALFLLGQSDGLMVMVRHQALCDTGLRDLANLADALATLMAGTVANDRRQAARAGAMLAARDERTKHNAQELCRALIPVRGGKVIPMRRAA